MDSTRRELLASLALAQVLPASLLRAAELPAAPDPILLRAVAGAALPHPPLHYGDATPGPILRVKRDAALRISLRNETGVPTSLDLQGLRAAPPLGGTGPLGGAVAAGSAAEFVLLPPDAGTFWFHPWILDPHRDATAQGLAGVLIVEEANPPEVDADLVSVLTDRWPLVAGPPSAALWIDGTAGARRETLRPGSRVRLRLVNASTRLAVGVACAGASPSVVAIDGQPSALFRPRGDVVPMGPGARYDLMLDLPPTAGAEVSFTLGDGPEPGPSFVLHTEGEPRGARGPIAALPPNPLLPATIALQASTRATLVAAATPDAWSLNGATGFTLSKAPLFRTKRGSPVTLTFRNASPRLVGFRVHGFPMRVLHDLDDGWEPYWREAVMVQPGATHYAAFVADRPGRWLIESPFFAQAAGGLRTWFEVS